MQFEASELKNVQNPNYSIPLEQLSVSFKDQSSSINTNTNTFSSFEKGKKMVVFETPIGKIFTAECNFQLNITPENKAGIYDGSIFVEVFTY